MDSTPMKQCRTCKEWYPHTAEYFHKQGATRLRGECKVCACARTNAWYYEHRDYVQKWREDNADELRVYFRSYQRSRRDSMTDEEKRVQLEVVRAHRAQNPELFRVRERRYRATHRTDGHRRVARRGLAVDFTVSDIRYAYGYFHGYCAICGEPLRDLFGERQPHIDHWIALSDSRHDNPGTVPTNMIPACSSCNLSKGASDPFDWLIKKFGPRRAAQIIARIEAFFATVRQTQPAHNNPTD